MLGYEMQHIKSADGRIYPVCCTLNVLEKVQKKYGYITTFQRLVSGIRENKEAETEDDKYVYVPIDIPAALDGLFWMINEGIDIENEEKEQQPFIEDRKEVARIIKACGLSLTEVTEILVNELLVCIEPKKAKSVQSRKIKRKLSSTLRGFFTFAKDT